MPIAACPVHPTILSTTSFPLLPTAHQLLVAPGSASLQGSCVEVLDTWPPYMAPYMGGMDHLAWQVPQPPPTVLPAVFRLAQHCEWGEHYGLLGSDGRLGGW
jgi:hypothetical protein